MSDHHSSDIRRQVIDFFLAQHFCGNAVSHMLYVSSCTYVLKFPFGSCRSIYPVNFLDLAITLRLLSLTVFFV